MRARTDDPARARSGQGGKFGAFRDEVRNAWAHPSNNGRRAQTLGRLTLFHLRANVLHQRCSFPLGDHSKIWADRQFPSTGKAVLGNPPDFGYMQAWREFLRPGTLFVDIGANAGIYSVWAADLGASVIAVEPDPDALRGAARKRGAQPVHVRGRVRRALQRVGGDAIHRRTGTLESCVARRGGRVGTGRRGDHVGPGPRRPNSARRQDRRRRSRTFRARRGADRHERRKVAGDPARIQPHRAGPLRRDAGASAGLVGGLRVFVLPAR